MTRMPDPNAPECDCGSLERHSKEPSVPIEFDEKLNEFHILGKSGEQIMIWHCPFCGGRTPRSRRDELFMHVTHAEMQRLNDLTRSLKSVTDVFNAFGTPDWDNPTGYGVTKADIAGRPQTTYYRTLTFKDLSATANVEAIVDLNDQVRFSFTPKDITST
jgi:hypothetical protein